jgi:hypothetical protein
MTLVVRRIVRATLLVAALSALGAPALADDPGRIDAYVTPYYNSSGPVVRIGTYSAGLSSKNQTTFVTTIRQMKQRWNQLNFLELYVGAVRLYDLGYRNEAVYWFYSAQYKGRQFAMLADPKRLGSIGDRGFELYHAQDAFFQLVGPYVNGYAFGDIDSLTGVIRKVQGENRAVQDLPAFYPDVAFIPKSRWQSANAQLNAGLGQLAASLFERKGAIARERAQNGTAARFSHLTSNPFP